MKQISKKCLQCNKVFSKSIYCSEKQWLVKKYCSQKCAGLAWIGHPAPKSSFKKGHKTWNKGSHKKTNDCLIKWREKGGGIGKEHPNWKGDNAGYGAIHSWVANHKGRPKKCQICSRTSNETRIHWSNIDHEYRRDLDDYIALCPICHKKHDLKNGLCNH